jgi:hypothetical protein
MSKKIKVRFNLGRGVNYMKWKVQYPNGHVNFYSPDQTQLVMSGCILKNSRSTALKIFSGNHKTVCAWILCDDIEILKVNVLWDNGRQVKYNPKVLPFWNIDGTDMDGSKFNNMYTFGKKLNIGHDSK